jgi:hypothetical protein
MTSLNARLCGALLACLACGCGEPDDPITALDPGQVSPGSACGVLNETRACSCANSGNGAQACTTQGWSFCACNSAQSPGGMTGGPGPGAPLGDPTLATPPGNLRADIVFDWPRTEPSSGSCEPGNYDGTFVGLYASGLTFVNAPIPVFALGTGLTPGLNFTLEQTADGETLRIANGKMTGTADGLFPFNGTITGTLNCTTNRFDAELDGYYSLGLDGIGKFHFKGPLLATYDPATHTMSNGTWKVVEYDPKPVLPGAGGEGTWSAGWKP